MTTFRVRPAPLRPELSFTLKDGLLSGSGWDLSLLDLTDLRFTGYKAAGRLIWRLDLIEGGVTRHVMFGLGLLSGLIGLGISIGAIANGRIVAVAISALLLLGIGAGLLRTCWPWATPRRVAPEILPDLLTGLVLDTQS